MLCCVWCVQISAPLLDMLLILSAFKNRLLLKMGFFGESLICILLNYKWLSKSGAENVQRCLTALVYVAYVQRFRCRWF